MVASLPVFFCGVCQRSPDRIEHSNLSFGSPDSKLGVTLARIQCHGEKRDIAFSFKWLAANRRRVEVFNGDKEQQDYGLRELRDLDGIALPTEIEASCGWQLAERIEPDRPIDQRFIRAMGRLPEINRPGLTPHGAAKMVEDFAMKLCHRLEDSRNNPVPTAEITDLTAGMARICEHIFKQFGTPEVASPNYIGDVIANSAEGDRTRGLFNQQTPELKPIPQTKLLE